jgi:hypothetical protein
LHFAPKGVLSIASASLDSNLCANPFYSVGGDGGGEIVAVGPPEEIVREKRSYTGAFLKPVLGRRENKKKRIQAAE